MSTRSLTIIVDNGWGKHKELVVMYRQCDGYCSGHGQDLKDLLADFVIVNGLNPAKYRGKRPANGAGCLAAQVVAHFKGQHDEGGGIYIHAAGSRDCGEEYRYTVTVPPEFGVIDLEVWRSYDGGKVLYKGPVNDFDPDMESKEDEEDAA